jgi:Nitroreductase family
MARMNAASFVQEGSCRTPEATTSRRNVRSFADRPIPAADPDQILEAGRHSRSSQNRQPRDFILLTDRQQLRELAKVCRAGHVAQPAAAIVIIVPAGDNEYHRAQLDLGQATMAMLAPQPGRERAGCDAPDEAGHRQLTAGRGDDQIAEPATSQHPRLRDNAHMRPAQPFIKHSPSLPFNLPRSRFALSVSSLLAVLPTSWRGAGRRFLEPGGLPGPGLPGFGALAWLGMVARMFRNPRRTRAGVSRPAGAGRSHGRRRSAASARARRSWA